ncbi:MAG: hypothetical protein EU529_05875 [Promethearchaeota archaeon]|nr:MAG: hypothetical protein EU529_05875 [Candidatus Lokiarchaeota archaeon]
MFDIVIGGGIVTISLTSVITFFIWILSNRRKWKRLLIKLGYDITSQNKKFLRGVMKLGKKWKKVLITELEITFKKLMSKSNEADTIAQINEFVKDTINKVKEYQHHDKFIEVKI